MKIIGIRVLLRTDVEAVVRIPGNTTRRTFRILSYREVCWVAC
jgi:hypothetical protein